MQQCCLSCNHVVYPSTCICSVLHCTEFCVLLSLYFATSLTAACVLQQYYVSCNMYFVYPATALCVPLCCRCPLICTTPSIHPLSCLLWTTPLPLPSLPCPLLGEGPSPLAAWSCHSPRAVWTQGRGCRPTSSCRECLSPHWLAAGTSLGTSCSIMSPPSSLPTRD